jgi:hypothetical protein
MEETRIIFNISSSTYYIIHPNMIHHAFSALPRLERYFELPHTEV